MKITVISIIIAALLIVGSVFVSRRDSAPSPNSQNNSSVQMVDGKQIIDIDVKGGYFPRKISAKSGVPTVIRFNTRSTFDCSSALRIPSLDIRKNLPPSGKTEIDIGTPKAGILTGSCSMGMYGFEINFT